MIQITNAGIWIDRHEAVVVKFTGNTSTVYRIASDVETRPREKGESSRPISDPKREERRRNQQTRFFRAVVDGAGDAKAIFILGPGETKGELRKEFEASSRRGVRLIGFETADRMTDRQLIARFKQLLA